MIEVGLSIRKRVIILCLLSSLVMSLAYAFQSGFWNIQNSGLIISVGTQVFEDEALSTPCTSIVWPPLTPGENCSHTIWIRNNGSSSVVLHMTVSEWEPLEASPHISPGWNRENEVLNPNGVINATLLLEVSPEILEITDYHFKITLSGERAQN